MEQGSPPPPFFSVVVPTYDRPERLAACLDALARQSRPAASFEVVVSDDGSARMPTAIVDWFRDRLRLTLVTGPNAGPATARNRGAARARGRYLAFVDDDCLPEPGWLESLERRFAAAPDALIGGGIANALPENPYSSATQLIVSYVYDYFERVPAPYRFFNTSNLAVGADGFRRLGGFAEDFALPAGEDYDLCHRWQHAGGRTLYAPEARVHHAHHLTLTTFCRQHFNYGRGLFTCRLRIARRSGRGIRGERGGFYVGLLRYPLAQGVGARRWLHAGLVALSQLLTAAGVLREALSTRRTPNGAPAAVEAPT